MIKKTVYCLLIGFLFNAIILAQGNSSIQYYDNCGVFDADPSNDCTQDCFGVWGGNAVLDECENCGGNGPKGNENCQGECIVEIDCFGICGGKAEKIGENCILHSHISITGYTKIGKNNTFYPFCSIGSAPQDLKYQGEKSFLIIGNNNTFRENVTVNPGTKAGELKTKIENN